MFARRARLQRPTRHFDGHSQPFREEEFVNKYFQIDFERS